MTITDYLSGINRATTGEKTDVANATKDLANLQAGAGSLPAKLKEALNTKLNNNKDIINQQADTMQAYFNAGPQAREKYQDVFNPFEKAKLVQQERSMALRPYDVLSGVLEDRMGDVNDIVQSGIQGWQGLVNAGVTKLDAAKSNLSNALQAYLSAVGQQENADQMSLEAAKAAESSRQFNISSGQEQQKINNQMDQFNRELSLKARSMSGGSGGLTKTEKDKLTAMTWTGIMEATGGDLSKIWGQIHANEGIWANAGVNVQALWDQWKANGGGVSSQPTSTGGFLSNLFNGNNAYTNTQMNLNTGKVPGNITPVGPKVLKPGDPGYVNFGAIKGYFQGGY